MARGPAIGSKLALAKADTWGTATSVNKANAALDYLSEDFGFGIPEYIDDASVARSWAGDPIYGNVNISGSFRAYLRYTSLEYVLAAPLGSAAASAGVAGVFAQRYTYTSDVYGKFATVAIDKGVSVHEFPSMKVAGFTISGQAGQPVEIQSRMMGNNNTVPAVVNTSLASATYRTQGLHVTFNQLSLLVATKSGGAPTYTSDKYEPASFEMAYDRPLAQHWVMNGSREIIEPILDAHPNATFRMTFPRYATAPAGTPGNFFMNAAKQNIALKAWLRAVGPTIPGTSVRYRLDVYMPNAFVQTVTSNIGGPQAIPQEVGLTLKSPPAVPTGLPSWIGGGGFALRSISAVATAPL